jgi:hypothetical protein
VRPGMAVEVAGEAAVEIAGEAPAPQATAD